MATQKKIDTVTQLTEKINQAKAMFFVDYRGLKHKQIEELRKLLRKTEGEFVVTKNRLLARALGEKSASLASLMKDATAMLFAHADEVAPVKELLKFLKAAGIGKTKGGFVGNSAITEAEVTRFSQLPPRQILLGRLAGQLNAPIQGLHYALSWNIRKLVYALNAVKGKK